MQEKLTLGSSGEYGNVAELRSKSATPLTEIDSLSLKLSTLRHGDHLCSFYDDAKHQDAVLMSFINAGLVAGERCICVVDDRTIEGLTAELKKIGVNVEREQAKGSLQFINRSEWRNPGEFEIATMAEGVKKVVNQALLPEWRGLWIAVEMTWTLIPDIEPGVLGEWEAFWNKLIEGMPAVLLCQYNRRRISPAAVYLALKTHPFVVAANDLYRNFYYEPPDLFMNPNAYADRSDWMLKQFERSRKFEEEHAERLNQTALRIQAEESEKRIINIFESITDGFIALDPQWKFRYVNQHAAKILQRNADELSRKIFWDVFPEAIGTLFDRECRKSLTEQTPSNFEIFYPKIKSWFEVNVYPSPGGLALYFQDVTSRKEMEEKLRQSLNEKEIMLKEIHHRVKNNLQVVASLLGLQSEEISDPEVRAQFRESRDRVQSMALIHEKLYSSENLAEINLEAYIHELVRELISSYLTDPNRIAVQITVERMSLPLNISMIIAFILHELLSNCLKYAFPENGSGKIEIFLNTEGNEKAQLIVKDNGAGLPADMDLDNLNTLGLRLVRLLTKQLDATLEVERDKGTKFSLVFPISGNKAH